MTQRARITSKNTCKIELSDGSYVLARGSMSWRAVQMLKDFVVDENEEVDMVRQFSNLVKFLKEAIVGWNFVDGEGKEIAFDPALVDDFDMETVSEVFVAIQKIYSAEKKSSTSSAQTLLADSNEEEPKTS